MSVLTVARTPPTTIPPDMMVLEAVRLMAERRVGAAAVVERDALVGMFTERDLMTRVVLANKSAATTRIGDVMTREVVAVDKNCTVGDALRQMVERHFRHLPVVDESRKVLGMLSMRYLLRHRVDLLSNQLDSVMNFFTADGPGG